MEGFGVIALDAVALRKVVPGAKQLHIGSRQRGTTFGEGRDVVAVQFVGGATH
jgi:hypothetical protein